MYADILFGVFLIWMQTFSLTIKEFLRCNSLMHIKGLLIKPIRKFVIFLSLFIGKLWVNLILWNIKAQLLETFEFLSYFFFKCIDNTEFVYSNQQADFLASITILILWQTVLVCCSCRFSSWTLGGIQPLNAKLKIESTGLASISLLGLL